MSTPDLGLPAGKSPNDPFLTQGEVDATTAAVLNLFAGYLVKDVSGSSHVTLDEADEARNAVVKLIGTLTGNINLILPDWEGKRYLIVNATTGNFTITCKTAAGTGIVVTQGYGAVLYCDGTDILRETVDQAAGTTRLSTTILAGVVSSPPATVQNLTSSATITLPTDGHTKRLSASGGAVTGIILTPGTVDGQELVLFNIEATNTITFATAATSNVADGTSAVIAALRRMAFTWDAASSRWYRSG